MSGESRTVETIAAPMFAPTSWYVSNIASSWLSRPSKNTTRFLIASCGTRSRFAFKRCWNIGALPDGA